MLNLNFLENLSLSFNCFCKSKKDSDDIDRKIYNISHEYKICILPISPDFDIDNLYPLTDHVELWNIFVIGNDKTYILANVKDPFINLPESETLYNKTGSNILPKELNAFFDGIWTKTLTGKQLQFYIVWNARLYFVNTYPFFNGRGKVIGAIMFMRAFETMPETRFTNLEGYLVPVRRSKEEKGINNNNASDVISHNINKLTNHFVDVRNNESLGNSDDTQPRISSPN